MIPATPTQAETDVLAERQKQRAKWGDKHDDDHDDGVLATASMALAGNLDPGGEGWIVDLVRKHADNPRQRLVIAAAFAIAETWTTPLTPEQLLRVATCHAMADDQMVAVVAFGPDWPDCVCALPFDLSHLGDEDGEWQFRFGRMPLAAYQNLPEHGGW